MKRTMFSTCALFAAALALMGAGREAEKGGERGGGQHAAAPARGSGKTSPTSRGSTAATGEPDRAASRTGGPASASSPSGAVIILVRTGTGAIRLTTTSPGVSAPSPERT